MIESYGTGIRRIFKLYENCPAQPTIEATPNAFKIVLPNMNAVSEETTEKSIMVTPQMQKVLDYISEHGKITDKEISALLDLKKTRTFTLAKQMCALGLIEGKGRGESKNYTIK